jgi:hypothetical protein
MLQIPRVSLLNKLPMMSIRLALVPLSLLSYTACGFLGGTGVYPETSLYCDNFLIYKLCARDMNNDGVVEFVYFQESEEVFMWRPGARDEIPPEMKIHKCAQPMEDSLAAITSRVFFVNEDTSFIERQDIKGAMMIKYMAKLPGVTTCNMRAEQEAAELKS